LDHVPAQVHGKRTETRFEFLRFALSPINRLKPGLDYLLENRRQATKTDCMIVFSMSGKTWKMKESG
jgi:hypothetical protein